MTNYNNNIVILTVSRMSENKISVAISISDTLMAQIKKQERTNKYRW